MNNNFCRNNKKIKSNDINQHMNDVTLDFNLKVGENVRKKEKSSNPAYFRVNSGYIQSNYDPSKIDDESKLKFNPILNQSQKSTMEYRCLNRFETLYRDVQNPDNIIPEFSFPGIGTRQLFIKKNKNKLN
tara:strand:- start:732 stop:1121 length:390 start_codon:yes stop_codon:yes gene_type:complete